MTVKAGLISRLLTATAVSVYPDHAPENAGALPTSTPYAVVTQIGNTPVLTFSGAIGLAHSRFRCELFAPTAAAVDSLATLVKGACSGFKGLLPDGTTVRGMFWEDAADDFLSPFHSDETGLHQRAVDVRIWHSE